MKTLALARLQKFLLHAEHVTTATNLKISENGEEPDPPPSHRIYILLMCSLSFSQS